MRLKSFDLRSETGKLVRPILNFYNVIEGVNSYLYREANTSQHNGDPIKAPLKPSTALQYGAEGFKRALNRVMKIAIRTGAFMAFFGGLSRRECGGRFYGKNCRQQDYSPGDNSHKKNINIY